MFGFRIALPRTTPPKPAHITVSPEEWERGVQVWADYCTRPNINWRRHGAMCERLLFGGEA
jgi:hypothetical protein